MKEVFKLERKFEKKTKTDYDKLLELVRQSGMEYRWASMFVKKLADDEREYEADEATTKWALERGFYPGRVELYGLTEENYREYLPDYSYFMLHPLNHHFRKWLDKLTLKYVLNSNGTEKCMPKYYVYVENNDNYTYLMDLPGHIEKNEDFLLNLLEDRKILAIKPNSGTSGGRGFMKVEWNEGNIKINNEAVGAEAFKTITTNLRNNIVTEYCKQHSELAKVWPDSECTLRLIMCKMPYDNIWDEAKWECIISMARFGASVSGGTSNMSAGGVGVGFDYETGQCKDFGLRFRRFCENGDTYCYEHPDTHVKWKDLVMPNWHKVKAEVEKVCQQIASLDYLGLDVIITEDGMSICEINSHPGMDPDQLMCNPVLADQNAIKFFEYHGLFDIDNSKLYDMYRASQVEI